VGSVSCTFAPWLDEFCAGAPEGVAAVIDMLAHSLHH